MNDEQNFPYLGIYLFLRKGKAILFNPLDDKLFQVNEKAAEILKFCDGKTDLEKIAKSTNATIDEIRGFLTEAEEKGHILFSKLPISKEKFIRGSLELDYPLTVAVEITNNCNLKCEGCYIFDTKNKVSNLDLEKARVILAKLNDAGVIRISISGGEPMSNPDFYEITKLAASSFPKSYIMTNGTLINEKTIKELSHYNKSISFRVSIDSITPSTHDKIRGVIGSFEKAINGIKLLKNAGFNVGIDVTLNPRNKNEILEIGKLASSLKADNFKVGMLYNLTNAKKLNWRLTEEEKNIISNNLEELKHTTNMFIFPWKYQGDLYPSKTRKVNCGAGNFGITVAPTGEVRPCNLIFIKVGNLLQDDLKKILRSKIPQTLRSLISPNKDICGNCEYSYLCENCHAMALINYKSAVDCKWIKQINKENKLLSDYTQEYNSCDKIVAD